ncbi:hypothetical protein DY000_02042069 [Brassica cretica]|uniref:Uncharacterized protein n=1 Tax=Brassica cretica TaxID=69181 RepID=A0ABQ7BLG4_BRACR|nr:hypothetical protein DY000_02042069 [Brassica cretica]
MFYIFTIKSLIPIDRKPDQRECKNEIPSVDASTSCLIYVGEGVLLGDDLKLAFRKSTLCWSWTAARFEANNAEVVQMKTKMTSLETQVESLTGIIQQLLSTGSNDSSILWTAYGNLLNPSTQFISQ